MIICKGYSGNESALPLFRDSLALDLIQAHTSANMHIYKLNNFIFLAKLLSKITMYH